MAAGAVVHGKNGVGDVDLPAARQKAKGEAVEHILETAARYPNEVVLVAIGPQTNVAQAILRDRATMQKLRSIVFMGGAARTSGNATAVAEANIAADPEAANLVLGLDVPKVMVGLDVTMKALLSPRELERILDSSDSACRLLGRVLAHYAHFYRSTQPDLEGCALHDVTSLTYLMHPELFTAVPAPVRVERTGEYTRGQTVVDLRPYSTAPPNCHVCLAVEGRGVIEDLLLTIEK